MIPGLKYGKFPVSYSYPFTETNIFLMIIYAFSSETGAKWTNIRNGFCCQEDLIEEATKVSYSAQDKTGKVKTSRVTSQMVVKITDIMITQEKIHF